MAEQVNSGERDKGVFSSTGGASKEASLRLWSGKEAERFMVSGCGEVRGSDGRSEGQLVREGGEVYSHATYVREGELGEGRSGRGVGGRDDGKRGRLARLEGQRTSECELLEG